MLGWCRCLAGGMESSQLTLACKGFTMAECARKAAHQQRPTELHRPSQPTEPGLDHVSSRPGGCCDAQTPNLAPTSPAHLYICWHLGAAVLKGHSGLLTLQAGKL